MDPIKEREGSQREKLAARLYAATVSSDIKLMEEAIWEGAPVSGFNFQNRGMEMTPLMTAASFANPEACLALLAAGAKLDEQDNGGACARSYAARYADAKTLKVLLGGAPLAPELGLALLFSACGGGNLENTTLMISLVADAGAKIDGLDAMMHAAELGRVECFIAVLAAGCDPSALSPEGFTAVEICRRNGHKCEADTLAGAVLAFQEAQGLKSILGSQGAAAPPKARSGL